MLRRDYEGEIFFKKRKSRLGCFILFLNEYNSVTICKSRWIKISNSSSFSSLPLSSSSFSDVEQCLRLLRNDCYTRYDNIPAMFIKAVEVNTMVLVAVRGLSNAA